MCSFLILLFIITYKIFMIIFLKKQIQKRLQKSLLYEKQCWILLKKCDIKLKLNKKKKGMMNKGNKII